MTRQPGSPLWTLKRAGNAEKPFVVHTDRYDVKVKGTEFNVSSYTDAREWSVSLVEGEVEILDGNDVNVVLTPDMKAEEIDCIIDVLLMGENLSCEFDIDDRVIRIK